MSELEAWKLYCAHVAGCATCQPATGKVCAEGLKLHDEWRQLEVHVPAPKKPKTRARRIISMRRR